MCLGCQALDHDMRLHLPQITASDRMRILTMHFPASAAQAEFVFKSEHSSRLYSDGAFIEEKNLSASARTQEPLNNV